MKFKDAMLVFLFFAIMGFLAGILIGCLVVVIT